MKISEMVINKRSNKFLKQFLQFGGVWRVFLWGMQWSLKKIMLDWMKLKLYNSYFLDATINKWIRRNEETARGIIWRWKTRPRVKMKDFGAAMVIGIFSCDRLSGEQDQGYKVKLFSSDSGNRVKMKHSGLKKIIMFEMSRQ